MRTPSLRFRHAITTACAAVLLFLVAPRIADAWEHPHSDAANSGFADVKTRVATASSMRIPNIGTFAPGAGPVVAKDGTVYVGSEQGKLWAFHADGSPYWSRDINGRQSIVASPVIDSQGNVYVIGVKSESDHTVIRLDSSLHKFTASGGYLFDVPLPRYGIGAAATAAPNIWQYNGAEAIMLPITYKNTVAPGYETHLVAILTGGQILADTTVADAIPTVTADTPGTATTAACVVPPFVGCILVFTGFSARAPQEVILPTPTAAIFTYAGGGTPFILVADGFQSFVGYTFDAATLTETFRVTGSDDVFRNFRTTPMVLPDGHALVSDVYSMRFLGPNMTKVAAVAGLYSYVAPTRLANGRVIVVTSNKEIALLDGNTILTKMPLGLGSMASAAASRNHLFVATDNALVTFDANGLQQLDRFDWDRGGINPPAIGPQGNVYGIANNILYVFPGPRQLPEGLLDQPLVEVTALPAQQTFNAPMTGNGNRLFACLELDGDDCGKGDYNEIALAWCQKQGYAKVQAYDVDSHKVKAEALDGRLCSKKKCKVFESIGCEN